MKDISVNQIIKTFKNKERKVILSTAESDDFLDVIQKKEEWTEKEYKKFFYAYSKQYKNSNPIDSLRIYSVRKKYNFTTNWNDYIKIIDSFESVEKQQEYIDYYFWYYGSSLTENYFKKLMKKSYFKNIDSKSRRRFLESNLKVDGEYDWVGKYFSQEELSQALEKHNFFISLLDDNFNYDANKIQKVKDYYIKYKELMSSKVKFKFFNKIVERGCLELIDFCYKEQKIKILNKMHLLWHVCADTAHGNVFETLNELKELGLKLTEKDLERVQKHSQWGYMENRDQLLLFFKTMKSEKAYKKLNTKLVSKDNPPKNKIKVKKI